jgi:putative tricarboxylic transport membrane protein
MRNPRDFWTGVVYVGVGAAAVVIARGYGLGTSLRMGPGYFPTALGVALVGIGLVSFLRAWLRDGSPIGPVRVTGLLAICGATLIFGLLVRGAGMIVALPLLVILSARASVHFRWRPTLLLAAGLTAFCIAVFLKGLGVPLPVVGPWLGG